MNNCYVCGAPSENPPWGQDDHTPSYEICECCGCTHGYEDSSRKGIANFRAKWLAAGGRWKYPSHKSLGFSLEQQLSQIPKELPAGIN